MNRLLTAFVMIACVALGAGAVTGLQALDRPAKVMAGVGKLSTRQLASELLGRVSTTFVADSRGDQPPNYGTYFFTQPRSFGGTLCWFDRIEIAGRVAEGTLEKEIGSVEENLAVTRMYGVLADASGLIDTKADYDAGCAKYRDFKNVFNAPNYATLHLPELFDAAVRAARSAQVRFAVTCEDWRSMQKKACDGVPILASVNLKNVRRVSSVELTQEQKPSAYTDTIQMAPIGQRGCGGQPDLLSFEIRTKPTWRPEVGDIKSINVKLTTVC